VEDRPRAAALMLASSASFAAMAAFVKLAPAVPLFEKVLFRNLVTLFVAGALVRRNRRPLLGRPGNLRWLLLRSVLGIGGVACYFYAVDHLLLADASMLTKLSPFVTTVIAAAALGEAITARTAVALAAGFAGGLLVIKPRFDLEVLPALVGAGSALFAGGAYAVVRFLRDREPPETIVFVFSLVSVVGLFPVVVPNFTLPSAVDAAWLVGIGLAAAGGQFGLTAAFRHAPAAEVSLISYSLIVFSALIGWLFWREVPDAASLLGGAMIIISGAVVVLRGRTPVAPTGGTPGGG